MKLGIMQPYFFPYIGYFQLINSVDRFILYDKVNYIQRGWMNRNRLQIKNGDPIFFNIPISKCNLNTNIDDVKINNTTNWRKRNLDLIYFNYKKSTSFKQVFPIIEEAINFNTNSLSSHNVNSINKICKYLDISTKIEVASDKHDKLEYNLENNLISHYPQNYSKKVIRVLELCRYEQAKYYHNAIGGRELYNKEIFLKNGLELKFVKSTCVQNNQFSSKFNPNLSIIDVLMNNEIYKVKKMLGDYELI